MRWLLLLLPLISAQDCAPPNPECPDHYTSPDPGNPCWRLILNGDSTEYCHKGRGVKLLTNNREAYFTCNEGENLDCSSVPKINLGYNGHLKGLKFDSCGANVSLTCVLNSLNATGVSELFLSRWTTRISESTFRDYNGLTKFRVFNSESVTRIPTETLKLYPSLTLVIFAQTNISNVTSQMFSDLGLTSLEHLQIIISKLTELPADAFVGLPKLHVLNLMQNNISVIDANGFYGLSNLTDLYLGQNFIENLPVDVFRHTPKLGTLLITRNRAGFRLQRGTLAGLKYLETIEISLDEGSLVLEDESLSNLPALKTCKLTDSGIKELPSDLFKGSSVIETLLLDGNEIEVLPETLFLDMENLKELSLSQNKLKTLLPENAPLYSGPFSSLKKLETLSLASNLLQNLNYQMFIGIKESLKNLDLSHNELQFDCVFIDKAFNGSKIGISEVETPLNMLVNLVNLNLSHNNISHVCIDFRRVFLLLRDLNLSYNKITSLTEEDMRFVQSKLNVNLRNNMITHLEPYRGPYKIKFSLSNNPINCDCTNYNFLELLNTINYDITNAICNQPQELKGVELTAISRLGKSEKYSLDDLVCELPDTPKNCECLVRRSRSRLECLCDDVVENLPSPINLTRYPFINEHDSTSYGMVLSLKSEKNTKLIPTFVTSLNLSYLNLDTVPYIPKHIEHVNLSHNHLERIPVELLSRNLSFDLAFNRFKCDCSHVYDVESLQVFGYKIGDYSDLVCADGIKVSTIQVPRLCDTYYSTAIGVSLAIGTIVFAVLLIVTYIYKLEIKIFLYNKGLTCLNKEDADASKKYDIFISFCSNDEDYVLDNLLPILERKYKVCIHTRDFNVGEDVLTQIYRAVADSRRTIIVASDAYFRSTWCLQEITAAYKQTELDQRTRAVVILRKDFDPKNVKLSDTIKTYINLNTWIKEDQYNFWDKLCYFLPRKITVEDLRIKEVTRKAIENLGHINNIFAKGIECSDLNDVQVDMKRDVTDKKLSDDCQEVKLAVRNLAGGLDAVCKEGRLVKNLPDGLDVICNGDGKLVNVAAKKDESNEEKCKL